MLRKIPMGSILKRILLKLGISQNQGVILCIVAGVIAIVVFVLILIILKRRRSKKVINVNLTDDKEASDKLPEGDYESVIKRIKQVKKKYKSILFASTEAGTLPVTIPVNIAIGLTKEKERCLLIDVDLKRDAVAKAFGLDAEQSDLRNMAVQTEIENLWVWPGHNFSQSKQMNIMEIVEKAEDKFDFILINAPSIVSSPDRKQIISAAQAAFICIKDTSEVKKLTDLIKPLDCKIIGPIQIP
ncbi:MAG: division plane positioning ATPase MipZ [Sedimentisphaerales bacterium]